jgi:UDP-GlcNAc:undecaprenyl-phosphate GlcNAc-1-phosphate transferase
MYSLLLLASTAFFTALLLTPLLRNLFLRFGFVDAPDGKRKVHAKAIPRIGGIAIMLAYLVAFCTLMLAGFQGSSFVRADLSLIWRLLPAAGLIFLVGLLDDLFVLKPYQKFAVQLLAAGLTVLAGLRIHFVHYHPLQPWLEVPVTLFWLVFCTNAFNLIDGMDGLAAGIGLFATLTALAAGLMSENFPLALATMPLAGALLGFLRYNFNPASVFLGDSGSYSIGFMLGCFGILWSQKSATLLGMTAPLLAFALPALDVCISIVRRFLRMQPLFGADRGHIHHKLLERGLTPRRAVLLLYAVSCLYAILSLIGSARGNQFAGVVLVLFGIVSWIGIQGLGYAEFHAAGRMLFQGSFRRTLNNELVLHGARLRLAEARSLQERWQALHQLCGDLGFCRIRMETPGMCMEACVAAECAPDKGGEGTCAACRNAWTVAVPVAEIGRIELSHGFGEGQGQMAFMAPLADVLREALLDVSAARGPVAHGPAARTSESPSTAASGEVF